MARKPIEFVDHPMDFPEKIPFRGFCRNVVDGDTFDALIDIGLNKYAYETLRLKDIDTPEIFRPKSEEEREAGHKAKELVESLILNKPIKLETYKDKTTFGRYVAKVWYRKDNEWHDLAQTLKDQGYEQHLYRTTTMTGSISQKMSECDVWVSQKTNESDESDVQKLAEALLFHKTRTGAISILECRSGWRVFMTPNTNLAYSVNNNNSFVDMIREAVAKLDAGTF